MDFNPNNWPAIDWGALRPALPVAVFPTEMFGDVWSNWIIASARGACCPIDYTATTLVSAVSALLGNVRWVQTSETWRETPVLWTLNVGRSGQSKTPGARPVLRPLHDTENYIAQDYPDRLREYQTQKALFEEACEQWKANLKSRNKNIAAQPYPDEPEEPVEPRLIISDITPERAGELAAENPRGLILYMDELSAWLSFDKYKIRAGSEVNFWLEANQGGTYTVDRVKGKKKLRISRLSIAVTGSIQFERLLPLLKGVNDGLCARILFAAPQELVPIVIRTDPDAQSRHDQAQRCFERLANLEMLTGRNDEPMPHYVPLSRASVETLQIFAQQTQGEAAQKSEHPIYRSALEKARGNAARLALVLEYLKWSTTRETKPEPQCVTPETMVDAIRAIEKYFLPNLKRLLSTADIANEDAAAQNLAHLLHDKQIASFNARELRRSHPGKFDSRTLGIACNELQEAAIIRKAEVPVPGRGRRRSDFVVNPQFLRTSLDDSEANASREASPIDPKNDWSFHREEAAS